MASDDDAVVAKARRTLKVGGACVLAVAIAFVVAFLVDDSRGAGLALVTAVVAAPLGLFLLYLGSRRPPDQR